MHIENVHSNRQSERELVKMVSMYGKYYKYGKEYRSWLYSLSPGGGNVGFSGRRLWNTNTYTYMHVSTHTSPEKKSLRSARRLVLDWGASHKTRDSRPYYLISLFVQSVSFRCSRHRSAPKAVWMPEREVWC